MMQKNFKMTETVAYGYSTESTQWELSNDYQYYRMEMAFIICCNLVLWTKIVLALKGFNRFNAAVRPRF